MTATIETKTYTLEQRAYKDHFTPVFAFNAASKEDAEGKANRWGRYHGFIDTDTRVREATENEVANWLHNEYIEYASCGR